jgi:serine/threonine protein kinase/predicted Zn-dependent protease
MNPTSSGPDLFNEVAHEFAERYRRGERPSLTEYAQRYPELAAEIRDLFPALMIVEEFGSAGGPGPHPGPAAGGEPPRELGEYRILREVGRGGMGVVYEAVQEPLGRHVALKLLPYNALASSERLERFRREARAAARLHHTHIVPVFSVGEHAGVHYYAMQFIRGQGLDEVLKEVRRLRGRHTSPSSATTVSLPLVAASVAEGLVTGRFPEPVGGAPAQPSPEGAVQHTVAAAAPPGGEGPGEGTGDTVRAPSPAQSSIATRPGTAYYRSVAQVGAQVAEALDYAHRQGILHRDIKPSNLLLDTAGQVWITDFGLAKAEDSDDLTHTGDVVGTLRYLAPERLHGQADARSDVYGLGITLYELLAQRPAFEDTNRARLIERVTHDEPPRPRRADPHVPRDLETIVLKAMAKEPAARYATAAALAEDLRRFLADRPIRARRSSVVEKLWRLCRRNPAVASLMGSVAALLVTVAVVASLAYWSTEEALKGESLAREQATKNLNLAETRAAEIHRALDDLATANTLLQSARSHADAGQWARAHEELSRAVELQRDNSFVWYQRGDLYTRLGLWDEAAADYAEAFRRQQLATPHQAWSHAVLRAWVGDQEGYRQACAVLPRRFAEEPYSAEEHKLARAYTLAAAPGLDLDWAEQVARRAVERDGGKSWNPHVLGLVYYRKGQYAQAVFYFQKSTEADPRWVNWIGEKGCLNPLGLALAYQRLGQTEKARQALADGGVAVDQFARSLLNSRDVPWIHVWQEWLEALLLYREASLLIDGTPPPEDPRLWVVRGRVLAVLNLKEKAAEACARAADLAGRDLSVRQACFRLYADLGQWNRAAAIHAAALKADPEEPQVLLQFFRYFVEREDWDKADRALEQVLREHARNPGLQLAAGQAYGQKARWQQAVAQYSAVLGLIEKGDPRRAAALVGRAQAWLQLREDGKALADLRAAGPETPDQAGERASLWRELAQHLFAARQYPEAAQAFDQVLKRNPGDGFSMHYRGHCNVQLQQWDRAFDDFSRAIELSPRDARFRYCRGRAYARRKLWQKAVTDLSIALELQPHWPKPDRNWSNPYQARGRAYCALGQWDKAAADYAELLRLDPGNEWHWYVSAALRLQIGDVAGYRRACREMLARFGNTDNPPVAEQTAKTCSLLPDAVSPFEPVLQLADRAAQGRESDPWIVVAKALAEHRVGSHAAAVEWLERLSPRADGKPVDATAFAVLALARHRLGQTQEARAALASARAILAKKMPDPDKGGYFEGDWHDWLRARILVREAEEALKGKA